MREAVVRINNDYQTKIQLPGRLRLHIFWRGDHDPDCHDHPCDFWTLPLVSYVEELSDGRRRTVKAFRIHKRRAEFAHRIVGALGASRPIVTLVWWGKKRRPWGFYTPNGWRIWREYLGLST